MPTILIIEDDPNSINILTRVLERGGHEIIAATEGLSGVKAISQQKIDLVLLDMGLPDLGGHTVAALIKRIPGNVPIVAVSASTEPAVESRALNYGCAGYITKPINTRTFCDQIAAYLSGDYPRTSVPQAAEVTAVEPSASVSPTANPPAAEPPADMKTAI